MVHTHLSYTMTKEKFLECLGLVSMEQLKSKSEVKRVERRRRTTANPKYNSNGFVELRQLTKRSRRFEEVEPSVKPSTPKRITLTATVKPKEVLLPKCYVCDQNDTELTCECCQSQYHADCIRVTGSKAPAPTRLSACPNCISARLESYKLEPLLSKNPETSPSSSSSGAKFHASSLSSSSSCSSSSVIPFAVQKNSTSISCRVNQSLESTKSKVMKKASSSSSATVGSTGNNSKASSMTKKTDVMCKPVLTSPFKSLTALTSKGAAAAKNLQGKQLSRLPNSNGDTNVVNGAPSSKAIKKKSKLNGVKAKTLSVTGKINNPHNSSLGGNPPKAIKHKASPLNNLNSNGNVNNEKSQSNLKHSNGSRLQSFSALTADQPLLMQRTILAMTAAAKSVMSSNGIRVVSPVSIIGDLKISTNSGPNNNNSLTDKEKASESSIV